MKKREKERKEVVQTAPVSNATTFPPKRNLKVGKPHVETTPFAVNETRSPRLTLSIFRVQHIVYFSASLVEGTCPSPFTVISTISIQIFLVNKHQIPYFLSLPLY